MGATPFYIGLMSGTSLDGVDGVLADFSGTSMTVLHHATAPFPDTLRAEFLALNQAQGHDELHRGALAANALARVYAQVVAQLLTDSGLQPAQVAAIGAHGQTVRHRPQEIDGTGYTLQLNNPALLAELSGIDVVADFRSRDLAAGGQGAPLVPAFHSEVFGRPGETLAVLNLGGIANLSVLGAGGTVLGFDCGPGNCLMDHWCQLHRGQPFDHDGAWGAGGSVKAPLLERLLAEPYLALPPPKSTGRDLFNRQWLHDRLEGLQDLEASDVQASLAEFTARTCAADFSRHAGAARTLVVWGGGALNCALMLRLCQALPGVDVCSTATRGLPPLQVEAAAFAWLARRAMQRESGNLASVTGARGARVLGAIYPR
ncbi:MAG: anhydro-N-acetylmuramic acid kinase [Burkholderiaceae bacterium]|nr:anhydro-N-acetylmuramic acid kinase [Burkholderiaceae bacterium]